MFLTILSIIPRITMIVLLSSGLIILLLRYPHIEEDIKKKIKRSVDAENIVVKKDTVNTSKVLYIVFITMFIIMILVFIFLPSE